MKKHAYRFILLAILQFIASPIVLQLNANTKIETFIQVGSAARTKADFENSIRAFLHALDLLRNSPDTNRLKTDILMNLGILYWNIGQVRESLDYFNQAEDIAKQYDQESKREFCSSAVQLTKLYLKAKDLREEKRDYQGSTKAFEEAIAISRKIQSGEHEAKCLRQLSINCDETESPKESFRLSMQARDIAKRLNIKRELGYDTFSLGHYYYKSNIYSLALENYENSLKIAQELNSPSDQADCAIAIGAVFIEVGQYDKALSYLTGALALYDKQRDAVGSARTLLNMGVVYRRRGFLTGNKEDLKKALSFYEKCLNIAQSHKSYQDQILIMNNVGSVYYDLADYSEAMRYFQGALEKAKLAKTKEMISMVSNNIGIVQATLGNYEESTKYYQQAIDLALEFEGGQILWEAYLEMANAYKKEGKFLIALENYQNSISVIEDIRSKIGLEDEKASFLGTDKHIEPYQQIIDLFITMDRTSPGKGYKEQAFNYLERAKARAFLDSLEVADIEISQRVDFKLLNREKEISGELSKLYSALAASPDARKSGIPQKIQNLEMEYESLKREIRLKNPAYADLRFPEIVTLEETRRKILDSRTAVCAYSIGKDRSYVFVITKNDLEVGVLPPRKELQAKITDYLKIITDKDSRDFRPGRELGRTLIPSALGPRVTRLIIIPDDWLNFLPFEALPLSSASPQFMVQKYRISYAPSLSSFLELLRRQKSRGSKTDLDLLAIGSPSSSRQGFNPLNLESLTPGPGKKAADSSAQPGLKFSRQEIRSIGSLFKPRKVWTASGDQATEEAIRSLPLTEFKILHFATHAFIDDKNPNRSYLLLSPSKSAEEDGFLQGREIYNLRINADLVTLAACQTGLGQLIRGEGIEGLSRAFFYAGASAVMMSLWAVDDQASSQLMERFYTHLRDAESITQALQETKQEMIQSGTLAHPFYWAGYVLSGQAEARVFPSSRTKEAILALSLAALGTIAALWIRRRKRPSSLR